MSPTLKTDDCIYKRLFQLFLFVLSYTATQCQNLDLKNFPASFGSFRIGMTLKEFTKIENNYHLPNHDSILLQVDILSPIQSSILGSDSNNNSPTPHKFLNHQLRKVFYFFNRKKKLVKINWLFVDAAETEHLTSNITAILGDPVSKQNNDNSVYKTVWQKDSVTLTCNYNKTDDQLFLCATNPFISEDLNVFNVNEKYGEQIKTEKQGKGNGTFTTTLTTLEKIVTTDMNIKKFESILPEWKTNTYYNWVGLASKKKANVEDVPVFHLAYDLKQKNNYVTVKIEIEENINAAISSIEVNHSVSGETLAKFKSDLNQRGYYLDEKLTDISYNFHENKSVYKNTHKGIMVLISNKNSGYSFEVRKL